MVFKKEGLTLKPNQSKVSPLCSQRLRKKNEFWKALILELAIKRVSFPETFMVFQIHFRNVRYDFKWHRRII